MTEQTLLIAQLYSCLFQCLMIRSLVLLVLSWKDLALALWMAAPFNPVPELLYPSRNLSFNEK